MEHGIYLEGIKRALRARAIHYDELAKRLKMSESGVKKMLNGKDLSFRRVLQICEVLGILPGELFSLSENASIAEVRLTTEQEDALLSNRELLAVYWGIAIDKSEAEEVRLQRGLGTGEIKKLLSRLVRLELLTERKSRYRPTHQGKFRWTEESKLVRALNQEWSALTLKRSLAQDADPRGLHRLVAMRLSPESLAALRSRISEAFDDAAAASEREEIARGRAGLENVTGLVALVPKGIYDL